MKKIITVILTALVFTGILLCGCTNGELTRKVPISKMKEDISKNSQIQSCFTSAYVNESQYKVEAIEIVKEQENEKDITTYSNVILENAYFSVSLYIKTIYNYYDHGGWIMDKLQIEETKEIIPVSGPDPNCVEEYIKQKGSINVLHQNDIISKSEYEISVTDTNLINAGTAHASAQVQTDVARFEGYFVYTWTESGWIPEENSRDFHVTNYTADYTSRLGHYTVNNDQYYAIGMEEYIIFDSFDIEILSIEGTAVTYILNSCSMRGFDYSVVTGQKQQAEFDPLHGSFHIGTYENALGSVPMIVSYRSYNTGWYVVESSLKKVP